MQHTEISKICLVLLLMESANWFVNNDMRGIASQSRDRNQHGAGYMSRRTSDIIRGWRARTAYLSVIKPRNIGLSVTKGVSLLQPPLARRHRGTITLINIRRKRLMMFDQKPRFTCITPLFLSVSHISRICSKFQSNKDKYFNCIKKYHAYLYNPTHKRACKFFLFHNI